MMWSKLSLHEIQIQRVASSSLILRLARLDSRPTSSPCSWRAGWTPPRPGTRGCCPCRANSVSPTRTTWVVVLARLARSVLWTRSASLSSILGSSVSSSQPTSQIPTSPSSPSSPQSPVAHCGPLWSPVVKISQSANKFANQQLVLLRK